MDLSKQEMTDAENERMAIPEYKFIKGTIHEYIDAEADIVKLKHALAFFMGVGETPEMAQLAQHEADLAAMKKRLRYVQWVALGSAASVGAIAGLMGFDWVGTFLRVLTTLPV